LFFEARMLIRGKGGATMIRYITVALLFLGSAGVAAAQWPPPFRDRWVGADLSGRYVNTSNGGGAEVFRSGRDFIFVNENGTPARFAYVGPRRLQMVSGDWNPATVATVLQRADGRLLLRFNEPGQRPGYWVRIR
jgi:hypothetical protein